jgi:biotin-dependent carboxylase-like uncharacterized protein
MDAALRVVEPGPYTSLQDHGRFGYQRFGMPVSGCLDSVAAAFANLSAGNPVPMPVLEIMSGAAAFQVEAASVRLAFAGAASSGLLEGQKLSRLKPCESTKLIRGDILRIEAPTRGMATYLAVQGGFQAEKVLGSVSTYARSNLGGFTGRIVQKGDRLPLLHGRAPEQSGMRLHAALTEPREIRLMPGPHGSCFAESSMRTLFSETYTISHSSDRMGLRLQGKPLLTSARGELLSYGTAHGLIQVPPNRQPVILLADRQTTGGYPCIATVISADMPKLARLSPGGSIRFRAVNYDEALRARRELAAFLQNLPDYLKPVIAAATMPEALFSGENLISGVTDGEI